MTTLHGLRANAGQFALLVGVNALVGAMVGQERTVLPLLAEGVFGLGSATATLTFLVAFGLAKAVANLAAGALADRYGRKPVLVVGWLIGVPVPLLIIAAPDWGWVVAANVLLGINQGLTWSTTVIMKIDLAGPARRGLALGLNEASGYLAVAGAALLTGLIAERAGLRPAPFLFGLAIAGLGLGLSVVFVRETRDHVATEAAGVDRAAAERPGPATLPWRSVVRRTTWSDRRLFAVSQAGLVNNLNDGLAWGLLPLHFAARGLPLGEVAVLTALYPATWGLLQVGTGALSDRTGRVPLIVLGMLVQGAALAIIAAGDGFAAWAVGAATLGLGTALVYPTLIARVSDLAAPVWRASAIGVYRLWRDLGFAAGAIVAGSIADAAGAPAAVAVVAALTAGSGLLVALVGRR
ncbi:MAG: MFS transporter [Candidatus Limnocylindria bacterium]